MRALELLDAGQSARVTQTYIGLVAGSRRAVSASCPCTSRWRLSPRARAVSVLGKEEAKIEAEESEFLAQVQLLGERLAAIKARLERGDGPPGKA